MQTTTKTTFINSGRTKHKGFEILNRIKKFILNGVDFLLSADKDPEEFKSIIKMAIDGIKQGLLLLKDLAEISISLFKLVASMIDKEFNIGK